MGAAGYQNKVKQMNRPVFMIEKKKKNSVRESFCEFLRNPGGIKLASVVYYWK